MNDMSSENQPDDGPADAEETPVEPETPSESDETGSKGNRARKIADSLDPYNYRSDREIFEGLGHDVDEMIKLSEQMGRPIKLDEYDNFVDGE